MVFSSPVFLFGFLPPVLVLYYLAARVSPRARNLVLALSGYVFYGWAGPRFVPLMLLTTTVDWALSLVIAENDWRIWRNWGQRFEALPPTSQNAPRSRTQYAAIVLSVISNLALLGYFKYFNLVFDTYRSLLLDAGMHPWGADDWVRIVLPLGISFYTFQSLSYTIDVYRGDARCMGNFIDFACFVSMFPHLVAGPILKFSFLAEQMEHRTLTVKKFARGVAFFCLGMAKKVLIANTCATVADAAFGAGSLAPREAWWGALAYSFQIYFDFSGYSDMAIGLGLMLGFVFARNFESPYHSVSVTDFWRRWHISLSTWLREYLYIPLGGNRKGRVRTYFNLLFTMLLGGLWHGASWNFVIWGALHGIALAWERYRYKKKHKLPAFLGQPVTFLFIMLCWVFFRTPTFPMAWHYLQSMAGMLPVAPTATLVSAMMYTPLQLLVMALAIVVTWCLPDTWEWTQNMSLAKAGVCLAAFWFTLIILTTQTYQPFIYFVF